MCAATKHQNPPETNMTQKEIPCGNIKNISDSLLDGLQSSVVFFDTEGIVFRTNEMARDELNFAGNEEGRRLTELLAVNCRGKSILPDILAGFSDPDVRRIVIPQYALLSTKNGDSVFFIMGTISRLECGNFMFSFRNVADEMTNNYTMKMALNPTRIFPWFYDFTSGVIVNDPRYYEYTGIPTRDNTMTMEEYSSRLHPDDRETMAHAFEMQLHGEHYPYPVPFRLRRGDDTYEWFEGLSTYLGEVNGKPYRLVGVCISTQAHKDIEQTLTEAKNKAEQGDALKSAFLANISHEIRTPLNAIVGFANLLTKGEIDLKSEEAKEYATLIEKKCNNLLTLVSDIIDLSRIETQTIEYSFTKHALGELLHEIYYNYTDSIPHGIELNLLLPADDIMITTDSIRLQQAVGQLVSNAIKFTSQGHIDLGYSLSSDGQSVRIFVSDTGCGIPTDQTEKIFERFYKIDNFTQGAGLGLSICKTIAERLGGKVTVSSELNKGSRFVLKLPIIPNKQNSTNMYG